MMVMKRSFISGNSFNLSESFSTSLNRLKSYYISYPLKNSLPLPTLRDNKLNSSSVLTKTLKNPCFYSNLNYSTSTKNKCKSIKNPDNSIKYAYFIPGTKIVGGLFKGVPIVANDNFPKDYPFLFKQVILPQRFSPNKRFMLCYQKVPVIDECVEHSNFMSDPISLDFSKMFTQSRNISALRDYLLNKFKHIFKDLDLYKIAECFENVVEGVNVVPLNAFYFESGRELIEFKVQNAYSAVYNNMHRGIIIEIGKISTNPEKISNLFLLLGLEPFINLTPYIDLKKFSEPRTTCSILAKNTYCCLLGLLYMEKGINAATEFLIQTYSIDGISAIGLSKFKTLKYSNSVKLLNELMVELNLPLPTFDVSAISDHQFDVKIKLGDRIIATGSSSIKKKAESRAALNALVSFYTKPLKIKRGRSIPKNSPTRKTSLAQARNCFKSKRTQRLKRR